MTEYKLTNFTANIIHQILMAPEWYANKPVYIPVKATNVLDKLEYFSKEHSFENKQAANAWSDLEFVLELEPKEAEAVKFCLEHFLSKGAFRLDVKTAKLIKLFNITGE